MSGSDRNMLDEIERGERWLAGISTPGSSAELVARVKGAVRRELTRGQKPMALRWRWPAWFGAVATAAAIALAVWVGWQASRSATSPSGPSIIAKSPTPRVAPVVREQAIPNASDGSVAFANEIDDKLTSLENWSKETSWDISGSSLAEVMDEIFSEPAKENATRRGV